MWPDDGWRPKTKRDHCTPKNSKPAIKYIVMWPGGSKLFINHSRGEVQRFCAEMARRHKTSTYYKVQEEGTCSSELKWC